MILLVSSFELVKVLKWENAAAPQLQLLHRDVPSSSSPPSRLEIIDDILYYSHKIFLSSTSSVKSTSLEEFQSLQKGHYGVSKTIKQIKWEFLRETYRKDVQVFVSCQVCQQTKYIRAALASLNQPIPIPTRIWEDISMNFIVDLPLIMAIRVVFNRLSKATHFGMLSPHFTTYKVTE